jgi:hypothetical protein
LHSPSINENPYSKIHAPVRPTFINRIILCRIVRRGRYFSPQVFVNQIPRLAATYTIDEKQDFTLAAGPAVQYIDEATRASVLRIGGDAHAAHTTRLSKPWLLKIMADYTQIASAYMRFQCNALLVYTFY